MGYKVIMELNKDKIMKCLRHCNGGDCENCKALGTACDATWKFHKEALRLIKELIAENEQLRLTTIKTVQEKIHQAAEASGVNKYEAQYVNQVVMLSDVDKAIDEMLED